MKTHFIKELTEPPRYASCRGFWETRAKVNRDMDEVGGRESIRAHYKGWGARKEKRIDLKLLRRWIYSQVGRNWSDVNADLRALSPGRGADDCVNYVDWVVATNTFMHDGKVMAMQRGQAYPAETSYAAVYVHPVSGLLMAAPKPISMRRMRRVHAENKAKKERETRIVLSATEELQLENGVWFLCAIGYLEQGDIKWQAKDDPNQKRYYIYGRDEKVSWNELPINLQRIYGALRPECHAHDYRGELVLCSNYKRVSYVASRKTACKKVLRANGL